MNNNNELRKVVVIKDFGFKRVGEILNLSYVVYKQMKKRGLVKDYDTTN